MDKCDKFADQKNNIYASKVKKERNEEEKCNKVITEY